MIRFLTALALLALPLTGGTAEATVPATYADRLETGTPARVVEVVDGDTVILDTGRQVRLVGIQAPKLPLGRPGFEK